MDSNVVLATPLFAGMNADEAVDLLVNMKVIQLHKGTPVFKEGDRGDRLFIISEGKVKLGRTAADGRETLLAVLGPGEIFGELSLFDPGPRSATATPVSETVCYELEHKVLSNWLQDRPRVAMQLLATLASRLRKTNEALSDMIFTDVAGRVAKILLDLGERFGEKNAHGIKVGHELTQEELAQLVGTSRESTNKALADFQARGWIQRTGRSITLVDLERLAKRAK